MDARDRGILNKLKNLLQKRVKLHQVILFGSRARGFPNASDFVQTMEAYLKSVADDKEI